MKRGFDRRGGASALARLALASTSLMALASAGHAMAADVDLPVATTSGDAPTAITAAAPDTRSDIRPTAAIVAVAAISNAAADSNASLLNARLQRLFTANDAAPAATDASTGAAAAADGTPAATTPPADNPYARLGTNPFVRFWNYQALEWGKASAPVDPTAPPAPASARDGWPVVPQTTPPMPFTDWPYGGTTLIGDNRTASVDSPLMVAIANTGLGKAMASAGIQLYGWVDYGGNISTSKVKGGNAPAAYDYNPNNIQLDQAVLYLERTPDTVQTDHIDWGFRLSAIYGENYRYTTAYGIASYQLLKDNHFYGYDFPMVYGELWIPKIMQGLMIRVGRYISLPDIEAQLAPNNYMYTHSITYTLDNYTNEGIQTTLAITKQVMLQVGVATGTEAPPWHMGSKLTNLFPNNAADLAIAQAYAEQNNLPVPTSANPLYPGATYLKDPGDKPAVTVCGRWQSLDGNNDVNICADAINHGQWGYNNLQWYGMTMYHKFNKFFHVSYEIYDEHQDGVANIDNPIVANVIIPDGGIPFSPQNIPYNAPAGAQCKSHVVYECKASSLGTVAYWNFSPNPLNNFSIRTEYYDDMQGQRTGYKAVYYELGLGWQHWLSPQIELRPEFTEYHSSHPSFDGGAKKHEGVFSGDIIAHF
jgi:hypothetical protein